MDQTAEITDLRILMLEDVPSDAELEQSVLRDAGLVFTALRVDTREAFERALDEFKPDIVLADNSLPAYNGREALEYVRSTHPQIPVIFVTGSLGDVEAVEMLKLGARDYVLKDELVRLAPAIKRSISQELGIRARKAAEGALHKSELRYRRLFEAAGDGILILDADTGKVVDANPFILDLLPYSLSECTGKMLWEIGLFKDIESGKAAFQELQANKYIRYDDLPLQTKGGRQIDVEFISNLYAAGERKVIQCNIRDITERKRVETKLQDSEERLRAIFDGALDGIALVDLETMQFAEANPGLCHMLGYSLEELAQLKVADIHPQQDWPNVLEKFNRQARGEIQLATDMPVKRKDGSVFYADINTAPVKFGGRNFIVGIFHDITERKEDQRQLQLSARLLDSTADSIMAFDLEGNVVYLNEIAWQLRGYTRDEMMAMNLRDLDTPESGAAIEARVKELMQKGSAIFESAHRRKDGSSFPIEVSARIVDLGASRLVLASVRDITERKLAEEVIRMRTRQLEEAQEIGHIGNWEWDAASNSSTWSREMYSLFDHEPGTFEFTLENFLSAPHPDDRAKVQEIVKESLENIEPTDFEFRIITSTGAIRWIHEKSKISADDNGKPDRVYGTCQDITANKRAEKALRDSEQKFRAIFDNTSDGIIVMDIEKHEVKFANGGMERMLGYGPDELIGFQMSRLHPPEALAQVGAQFENDANGGHSKVQDMPMLTKDGRILYADLNGAPVEIGGQRYLLGAFRDATERRKTERTLHHLNRTLRALSAGNHALVHAGNETELLENMCRATAEAGYVLAWVGYALQDEKKSIVPIAVFGDNNAYVEKQNITWDEQPSGRGPTGVAVRTGQTQIANDIANDPRMEPWREATARFGLAASIALPLKDDGKIIGSLTIYASETGAFGPEQVELLEEMAGDLAYGIVTLRTRVEQSQHAIILRQSLEQSIETIADTVEARDPYTAGHQRRVSELAMAIAREMGLPEEQINGIHLAGIIHDLGKIHVPAEILSKPGKLNDIEFQLIKMHPQAGYDILKHVKFPWPIADIVWQHHERLDGSGYPQGLKGDAILLESRIMAVADVVEAMSSHRPYRPGLGIDFALNEIVRGRDSAYDPVVVDACLKLFAEKRFTFSGA
jgi:PAS domain S-box-containing protein